MFLKILTLQCLKSWLFSTNINNPVTPVYLPLWIASGGAWLKS